MNKRRAPQGRWSWQFGWMQPSGGCRLRLRRRRRGSRRGRLARLGWGVPNPELQGGRPGAGWLPESIQDRTAARQDWTDFSHGDPAWRRTDAMRSQTDQEENRSRVRSLLYGMIVHGNTSAQNELMEMLEEMTEAEKKVCEAALQMSPEVIDFLATEPEKEPWK